MKSKNMSKILMDNILYICLLLMIVIIAETMKKSL